MSLQYIPKPIRQKVAEIARFRCGYCLTSQQIIGPLLEIDHLIPVARGGTSDEENLWLACPLCNGAKSDQCEAVDPLTQEAVPIFNPRHNDWHEHFRWIEDGAIIQGCTPIGRATVVALKMNQADVVATRRLWVAVGWHPPKD